jgi:hypothetical protein
MTTSAKLQRRFTYAFLSAYAFDIHMGDVYFHGARELALQQKIAMRFAATKFLFLDSSKLKPEGDGERAYTVHELLETSHAVTIYTVSVNDKHDDWVMEGFDKLGEELFDPHAAPKEQEASVPAHCGSHRSPRQRGTHRARRVLALEVGAHGQEPGLAFG